MSRIERLLESYDWKEEFIGIWTHSKFNHMLDINSGGIAVHDLDANMMDYIGEDERDYEQMMFIKKYNHVDLRADMPF